MTRSGISPYGLKFICSFICESYSSFYILSKHVNVNAEKTDRQNRLIHTTGTAPVKPLFGKAAKKRGAGLKHKTSAVAFPTVLIQ